MSVQWEDNVNKPKIIVGTRTGPKIDWLNPIAMSQLQKVVERRGNSVVLDGRAYDLTYGHYFNFPKSETGTLECVRIKRADGGFVPFGYLQVQRVLDFQFDD